MSYEGITYVSTNSGIEPKVISDEELERLKAQFEYNKVSKTGKLQIDKMVRIVEAAKIQQSPAERERMMALCAVDRSRGGARPLEGQKRKERRAPLLAAGLQRGGARNRCMGLVS